MWFPSWVWTTTTIMNNSEFRIIVPFRRMNFSSGPLLFNMAQQHYGPITHPCNYSWKEHFVVKTQDYEKQVILPTPCQFLLHTTYFKNSNFILFMSSSLFLPFSFSSYNIHMHWLLTELFLLLWLVSSRCIVTMVDYLLHWVCDCHRDECCGGNGRGV